MNIQGSFNCPVFMNTITTREDEKRYLIVTRAQGKQDPENHIWALPTVASATDAGYGTVNKTPTFCRI